MKSIFTNEYEILLRRLIAARKAAGMTQQELAGHRGRFKSESRLMDTQEVLATASARLQSLTGHVCLQTRISPVG